jgi:hypothetical protein
MATDLVLIHQLLTYINENETITVENGVYSPDHLIIHALLFLAEDCLTGPDGYKHIHELKKQGWNIHPGDQDRFGWLTGCIELKRGLIVFG